MILIGCKIIQKIVNNGALHRRIPVSSSYLRKNHYFCKCFKHSDKMKVRFNRWYNALLTMLLSMLGFESCSSLGEEVPVEYGVPHANYIVKGIVTDEAGAPIQGIKVTGPAPTYSSMINQTAITDESGSFKLEEFTSFHGGYIAVEDTDGEANGGDFKSDTLNIYDIKDSKQIEQGERWYEGKFEVTANFKLKKK